MAALAYVLLPVTGAVAYFGGATARARFHGLQAIVYGLLWVAVLYGCARLSVTATQLAFGIGGLLWLGLIVTTALGLNPRLPLVGGWLKAQAEASPRGLDGAPRDEA